MNVIHALPASAVSVPGRIGLFGLAAGLGALGAIAWDKQLGYWLYFGFLQYFLDPRAQIASLAVGVALGFLIGLAHVVHM